MAGEKSDDGLIGAARDADTTTQLEMVQAVYEARLEQYLDIRGDYINKLIDEGLIGRFDEEEGPIADHCEEHPYDPLCHEAVGSENLEERVGSFLEVRDEFLQNLKEQRVVPVVWDSDDEGEGDASPETVEQTFDSGEEPFLPRFDDQLRVIECRIIPWLPDCFDPSSLTEGYCRRFPEDPRCRNRSKSTAPTSTDGSGHSEPSTRSLPDGGGCVETWEHLYRYRNDVQR